MTKHPEHDYTLDLAWTGNHGEGTRGYTSWAPSHEIPAPGKPVLTCSVNFPVRCSPGVSLEEDG